MSIEQSYDTQTPESLTEHLDELDTQYQQAVEFLANLASERSILINLIQRKGLHD